MRKNWLIFLLAPTALMGCTATNMNVTPTGIAPKTAALVENCKSTSEAEISALFDRWNASLQTGDPHKVVANYAPRSILLPTVSNKPRLTPAEKED